MKKNILILGANGFIGRNLVNYTLTNNFLNEYSLILAGKNDIYGRLEGITYKVTDLTDRSLLEDLLITVRPNYILNLAGEISDNLESCVYLNAELPRRLMEIIIEKQIHVENLLLVGSAAEYGSNSNVPLTESDELKPLNPYGLSKVIQTDYFKYYRNRVNVNLARTFNIIGPFISNKLSIGSFVEKINKSKNGEDIFTGNLSSKRDYLYVDDVIDAFFRILVSGKPGEVYNVCSGDVISMNAILDSLIEASGKDLNVKIDPELFKKIDVPLSYGNNEKLMDHTGWKPTMNIQNMCSRLFSNDRQ